MFRPLTGPARDVAILIARVLLGVVLCAHGWQKIVQNGLARTTAAFEEMGIPLPPVSATYSAVVELVGGALLILGAATTIVALLVVLDMLGAAVLVHVSKGIFVTGGGWELVGVIMVGALLLAAAGAGRYSIDHLLAARAKFPA